MKKKRPDPEKIDDETPELTREDFRNARPFSEVFPALHAGWKRSRGRPRKANPKREVKLRLDPDIVETFKAHGSGWQTRMNDVLKAWVKRHPA